MRMYTLASLQGDGDDCNIDRVGDAISWPYFDGAFYSGLRISASRQRMLNRGMLTNVAEMPG